MSVQISYKKQFIFGIISLIVVLVIVEGFANIWLFEINKCAFEKSELFNDMSPETKRQLCQQFYDIQFGTNEVSIQRQLGGLTGMNQEEFTLMMKGLEVLNLPKKKKTIYLEYF